MFRGMTHLFFTMQAYQQIYGSIKEEGNHVAYTHDGIQGVLVPEADEWDF